MRSFIAVIDEGSLQAAARRLHTSQQTIGRHLALLESQLNGLLFVRTGRQLVPTQAALDMASHARTMEGGAHAIERLFIASDERVAGIVRITTCQNVGNYLMPHFLTKLRLLWPEITIELIVTNCVTNLARREADIAIRLVQPQQDSLIAKRIRNFEAGCYVSKDYLNRHGEPKDISDLLSHNLIGFEYSDPILRMLKAKQLSIDKDIFCFRVNDVTVQMQAVRAGLGICFFPQFVGWSNQDLQQLFTQTSFVTLPVWLVVHNGIHTSPKIRIVYDFLAQEIANIKEG